MPAPEVVLFDVNETLSDMQQLRTRFVEVGSPPELIESWFAGTLRDGFALAAAGAYADFRSVALSVLHGRLAAVDSLRSDAREAAEHILDGFAELDVHPDVEEGVRTLAAAGVRMATLTNGAAGVAEKLLERAGLSDLFERRFSVDEVRRWKPAREPYIHAAHELGVPLEHCTLIAVHSWDVDGAKRAGMRGAWLNRKNSAYPEFFGPPDATGPTLGELVGKLLTT